MSYRTHLSITKLAREEYEAKKLPVIDLAAFGWNLMSHRPEFRAAQAAGKK